MQQGKLLGGFGLVAATQKLISTVIGAIKIYIAFSKEQSTLAGVLGVTRDETVALTDDAKRLGRATEFTAVEVTQLQTAYARLGFSQREILDMTEATLAGSSAMQSELGETATLTGAIIRSFNKDSKESAQVIDVMASATQKSALDFQKLQVAIPIVGSAANAVGESFETMTARLAAASDAGIDASTSATSLRNIYIELKKAGLSMDDALTQINSSTDKLSTANELFGKRAAVTALVLADNKVKVKELANEFDHAAGAAGRLQATQLDNLDGDIKKLSSAWEGFMLLVEKGDGMFRNIVQNTTKLVNAISGASSDWAAIGADQANKTLKAIERSSSTSKEYAASLKIAIDAQKELNEETYQKGVIDRLQHKSYIKGKEIQLKLEEQGAIALKDMREKETIERFDVENKSIEDLKRLRESLSTFTIGKEKEKADLLLPLINEQLQKRLDAIALEEDARAQAKLKSDKEAEDLADKLEEDDAKEIERDLTKEEREIEKDQREIDRLEEKNRKKADSEFKYSEKQRTREEKANEKALKTEQKLDEQKKKSKSKLANALAGITRALFEKNKAAQIAAIGIEKASAIAQIWSNTAIANAKAVAAAPITGGLPFTAINTTIAAVNTGIALAEAANGVSSINSQKFATGGVVQGPVTGDTVPIMANGEEMILTKQQQANLFQKANQTGGQDFDYERLASLINDKQVVVLESDITEAQQNVSVRESEFQG